MPTPFTRSGYRELLETARASSYRFISFEEHDRVSDDERVCLLRHDVDADPGAALELARIEHELGVPATYFFMFRSPFYNLLSRPNQLIAHEIHSLGHWIGLHHDIGFAPSNGVGIEAAIRTEAEFLERTLGAPVKAVSFHQPAYALRDPRTVRIDGLTMAWDVPEYLYLSDANKAPQTTVIYRLVEEAAYPRLHILIHPLWWTTDEPDASTESLWEEAILRNYDRMQAQILGTERAFGSPRRLRIEREPT